MQAHPVADIFPPMSEAEYQALKDDIAAHGVREPIWMWHGWIIDGRHRHRAAEELDCRCPTREFEGDESALVPFVISLNLKRRHLNESQRALVAARIATLEKGRPGNPPIGGLKQPDAASALNVSERVIQRVKRVEREAPDLIPHIERGDMTVDRAESMIKRNMRLVEIEKQKEDLAKAKPAAPLGLFHVIAIDPPWPYDEGTPDSYDPQGRRAASPYPEMSLEQIGNIMLPAADDCVVWLWTTHKFMRHAFPLLDRWCFTERAIVTWAKDRMGLGRWLRSQSEFCIMATRGSPVLRLTNQTTVLHGPMREHSRKPDEFYAMVESLCHGRRLDYFSREKREGWEQFGNDTQRFAVG